MNFCYLAYAIMAYSLGNMIIIPANVIIFGQFDEPRVLIAGAILATATAGLHEIIETINNFQLTPGSL